MASRLVAAAASSSSSLARLVPRRGIADDIPERFRKVNLWEDPLSPMRWKDNHFMLATMSIWGSVMYVVFFREKENKAKVPRAQA